MGDLAELVEISKAKISALISKPKMSEKLLNKPPFRFLHDTIMAIIQTTGFGDGLFDETESNSAAINDKSSKMAYLDKIFKFIGICKGQVLDVRSAKVVSGLEPEYTNIFLIALAECATDSSIDNQEAVSRCLAGEEPGQRPPPQKNQNAMAESKMPEIPSSNSESKSHKNVPIEDLKSIDSKPLMEAKMPVDIDPSQIAPERGKSRSGTRGGKPTQQTGDIGLGGITGMSVPNLDSEIEKCDGSIELTQALLGELITRPKLSSKLLGKPPFRFLFDIVMEVMKNTGFSDGLYSDFESDSANVTDKASKIQFLEKIIKLVGIQLNTLVEAKPAKIVAGIDVQNTNNFLQLLAVAAKHAPDSKSAVKVVIEQYSETSNTPVQQQEQFQQPQNNSQAKEDNKPSDALDINMSKPTSASHALENIQSEPPSEPKDRPSHERMYEPPRQETIDQMNNIKNEDLNDTDSKRSARPTTARRRPPKIKEGAKEIQNKDIAPAPKKAEGIIIDGMGDDDEDDIIEEETRLVDEFKAESKEVIDENMADPQSKLVKDIMSRQAEQEASLKPNNMMTEESKGSPDSKEVSNNANTGGGGIRLGRLRKTGLEKKSSLASMSSLGEGELEKMRTSIQVLVQNTGPLGTCMDYIQEDISLMTAELHKWEDECRKYEIEYEESRRKTKEIIHPLKVELAEVEDQVIELIGKISSAKATIARNDDKIQQILKLSSTA